MFMHREYRNHPPGEKDDFPLEEALKSVVENAPNLKRLRICNPRLYTKGAVEYFCSQNEIASIRKLTSLVSLSFVKNVNLPCEALAEILRDCKHLKKIVFGIHKIVAKQDGFLCKMKFKPKRVSEFRFLKMTIQLVEIIVDCSGLEYEEKLEEFPYLPEIKTAIFRCSQHSSHALRSFLNKNDIVSLLSTDIFSTGITCRLGSLTQTS
ncbi:Hypothetical predicted protein [Cloeon dipterum]|uniref:F-box domain-containing protein n=1 Tax=Cloeon dipterum TaxID=197152 RepID=A0A8S1DQG4_9INSE|nr:Hypothetical predicted protein [Cloeon dipterum]